MKKYPKYKPSGVEWIGEIPEHWEVKKTKYCFKYTTGFTPPTGQNEYYNGDHIWITISDMNQKYIAESSTKLSSEAIEKYKPDVTPKGSLLFSFKLSVGKVAFACRDVYTNEAIISIMLNEHINLDYFYYILPDQLLRNANENIYGAKLLNQELIKNASIIFPPPEVQTAIANYLDEKTAKIDTLIEKKKKLIELLKEERTAVINQAVTRGINPSVRLKDSGIEWLGKIPEHWDVKKLKYIKALIKNAFVDGPFGSNLKTEHFIQNGEVYVIDSGFVTSGNFVLTRAFKTISFEHFQTINRSECKKDDIIISKIGANFGMSGILPDLDKPSVVSGNSLKLTVDTKKYMLKYIHYILLNLKINGQIDLLVKGSAQPALTLGLLNELKLAVTPEAKEQIKIVDYIQTETKTIDDTVSKIEKEIDLLAEYRTALISEVVTGKIDVRSMV